jgi:hypothetical protein
MSGFSTAVAIVMLGPNGHALVVTHMQNSKR